MLDFAFTLEPRFSFTQCPSRNVRFREAVIKIGVVVWVTHLDMHPDY